MDRALRSFVRVVLCASCASAADSNAAPGAAAPATSSPASTDKKGPHPAK